MNSNRLLYEKSPYLLQHAYNPVDWYPWGEEAFESAEKANRPVFLSIGYSTCHWCHVMAHESFEDPEVAGLMNDTFVSVKVDREERPDLDNIYMTVCQMLTGSGGWPLSIIMTPQRKPFFAGTYIPRSTRSGRIGMLDLIPRVREMWETRFREITESVQKVDKALQEIGNVAPGMELGIDTLNRAYKDLSKRFDDQKGGFGKAPKFPTAHNLFFLLRYWKRTGEIRALDMVEQTLNHMRRGGIYDHIGFGFHRYSTDREWLVPHFEKMLYDQALISLACIETFQATGKKEYAVTANEIFTYVLRDMTDKEGGFYSAEDADSEGEEGKFYIWYEKEIRQFLTREDADIICRVFNIERDGNFRDESTGMMKMANIMFIKDSIPDIARVLNIDISDLEEKIEAARRKLFYKRLERMPPHKDDKILTDWNGLMIASLSKGAQVFGKKEYLVSAQKTVDFIMGRMCDPDGGLLHRYRKGESGIKANVDDYAFLVWGLIELYEAAFDSKYLEIAIGLNRDMISLFWDDARGGLFFSGKQAKDLIIRKKESYDGALPSGNSVAMLNFLRLAHFTGNTDLEEKAVSIGKAFSNIVREQPSAYTQLLSAVDFCIGPVCDVVIAGETGSIDTIEMLKALRRKFIPNMVTLMRTSEEASPGIDNLAGFIKNYKSIGGTATAYVCRGNSCKKPVTKPDEMLELIEG